MGDEGALDEPLHVACENGHTETARALIQLGVSIDACTWNDKTPLMLCAEAEHTETGELVS